MMETRSEKQRVAKQSFNVKQSVKDTAQLLKSMANDIKHVRTIADLHTIRRTYFQKIEIIYLSLIATWALFTITAINSVQFFLLAAFFSVAIMAVVTPAVVGLLMYVYDIVSAIIERDKVSFVRQSKRFIMIILPLMAIVWIYTWIVINT